MKIQIAAALLLSTAAFSPQQRGWVSGITAKPDANVGTIQFTVGGRNPCGAVNMDFGDGTVATNTIHELPTSFPHEYTRVGDYVVSAKGTGNCDGMATTRVNVPRVRPRWLDPRPQPAADWTDEQFRQLDRNGDNFISRVEWRRDLSEFQRVDRNGDDRLSRNEFLDGDKADKADKPDKTDKPEKPDKADKSVTITVSSREAWTDTGLNVRVGDELNIDAKGKIQFGPKKGDTAGPNGAPGNRRATASAPMPRLAIGALIARVGNSAPFDAATKGKRIREPEDGRLYLGINDDNLRDNSGEFRVTVSIKAAKDGRGRGGR